MKQLTVLMLVLTLVNCSCSGPKLKDKYEIKSILLKSAEDWSKGDLEAFMEPYWKSDSLQFIGGGGITYGWQQTLDNYKKRYPDADHTGVLTFEILRIDQLSYNLYSVVGKYHLKRNVGNAEGIYTLIMKKIQGKWVIISDHSS